MHNVCTVKVHESDDAHLDYTFKNPILLQLFAWNFGHWANSIGPLKGSFDMTPKTWKINASGDTATTLSRRKLRNLGSPQFSDICLIYGMNAFGNNVDLESLAPIIIEEVGMGCCSYSKRIM